MSCDLIINLIDEHNESGILLTAKYNPKEVLFLYTKDEDVTSLNAIKSYYKNKFPTCIVLEEKFDIDDFKGTEKIILKHKNKQAILNLTPGKKYINLILYTLCLKNNIQCKYLNIEKEELTTFSIDSITTEKQSFVDLDVEDMIKSIGGSIVVDSTDVCDINIIEKMTYLIARNLISWEKYKIRLSDNTVFIHDESNPMAMRVDKALLNFEENRLLTKCIEFLVSNNQIKLKEEGTFYKISFLNDYIKGFIFKSGTWLEVLTKSIVEKIEVVDDVKSGVLFLWNDEQTRVKNELDVVAIKDSVLICISCKDSKKYDEVALNELNVYANQLGGEHVKKILVATKEPAKGTVFQRAEEMDINIVIFDGDIEKFKNRLEGIIKL